MILLEYSRIKTLLRGDGRDYSTMGTNANAGVSDFIITNHILKRERPSRLRYEYNIHCAYIIIILQMRLIIAKAATFKPQRTFKPNLVENGQ